MKLNSLDDLFVEDLKDLYDAEKQLVAALPDVIENVSSLELADALRLHLQETRQHVARLEQVFELLDIRPKAKTCEAMAGLLEEGEEILSQDTDPQVKDAGIIAAAQRIEHYEIAGYGCACAWAKILRQKEAGQLLHETLTEEKAADETLSRIAESINAEAVSQ